MKTFKNIQIATFFTLLLYIPNTFCQIYEQPINTDVCFGDTTSIFLTNPDITSNYQWQKNGINIPNETDSVLYFNGATFQDIGYYNCIVNNSNSTFCSDTVSLSVYSKPFVNLGNDTTLYFNDTLILHAGANFDTYIWSNQTYDSTLVIIPNSSTSGSHSYSISVSTNGCVGSDTINITYGVITDAESKSKYKDFILFPNPNNGNFTIRFTDNQKGEIKIRIFDIYGKQVGLLNDNKNSNSYTKELHLSHLPAGCYVLSTESQNTRTIKSFIIR